MVLGSSPFNRLYLGNYFCSLFLRVLRCFSSPGSPRITMYSLFDTSSSNQWVSPFGYLRIFAYLLLPVAFRCQSRPSSPISAQASTVRSCFLFLSLSISLDCSSSYFATSIIQFSKIYSFLKIPPNVFLPQPYSFMVGLNGLEPSTSRLSGVRSNQLSYRPPGVFFLKDSIFQN